MMSVPVMSDGIRSGVNWMRLKTSPSVWASVRTSSVLAVPGRPVIRQWPPTNSEISTCSMHLFLSDNHLADFAHDAALDLLEAVDPFF